MKTKNSKWLDDVNEELTKLLNEGDTLQTVGSDNPNNTKK